MEQMQRNNVGHKNKINMFRCFLRTNTELYVFDKDIGDNGTERENRRGYYSRTVFSLKL